MPAVNTLTVEYWEINPNSSPVLDFVSEVEPAGARARIQKSIEYLQEQGMFLLTNPKIFKKVSGYDHIYELRINWGKMAYRIMVVVQEAVAWLVHAFRKTTNKLSQRDLNIAVRRRDLIYALEIT